MTRADEDTFWTSDDFGHKVDMLGRRAGDVGQNGQNVGTDLLEIGGQLAEATIRVMTLSFTTLSVQTETKPRLQTRFVLKHTAKTPLMRLIVAF